MVIVVLQWQCKLPVDRFVEFVCFAGKGTALWAEIDLCDRGGVVSSWGVCLCALVDLDGGPAMNNDNGNFIDRRKY